MVLWGIAGLALIVAFAALIFARRVSRKLEALHQSYWELRYDYTRLRSQVSQLGPGEPEPEPAPPQSSSTFIPLSSMKKKNE